MCVFTKTGNFRKSRENKKSSAREVTSFTSLQFAQMLKIQYITYSALGVEVGVSSEEGGESPGLVPASEELRAGLAEETAHVRACIVET